MTYPDSALCPDCARVQRTAGGKLADHNRQVHETGEPPRDVPCDGSGKKVR